MVTHSSTEIADLRRDVIELREWKAAVLGCCKACDGFDALQWGGDKDGWGFVMFFIDHLNTRALRASLTTASGEAARALDPATVERCYQAALEERCQRGTPWDLACTTIARKLLGLIGEAHRAPVDVAKPAPDQRDVRVAAIKECIRRIDDLRCIPINSTHDRTEALRDAQVSLRALALTSTDGAAK